MTIETTRPTNNGSTPRSCALAGSQTPAPTTPRPTPRGPTSGRDQTTPQAKAQAPLIPHAPAGSTATRPITAPPMPMPGTSTGSTSSPQAKGLATPESTPPAGSQTTAAARDASLPIVHSPLPYDIPGDHMWGGAQLATVAGEQDQPTAKMPAMPNVEPLSAVDDPQAVRPCATPNILAPAGGSEQGQRAAINEASPKEVPPLADPFLALAADVLDDLEKVRIANENRLRQLTRDETDADGEERGFGLDESHPDVARLAALVEMLGQAEHQAALNLQRMMRRHPLGPWVKARRGVGEKQAARLLAAIGDPYWNTLHDRPRTVSELWAYCGYHVMKTPVSDQYGRAAQMFAVADGSDIPADQPGLDAHALRVGGEHAGGANHYAPDAHEPSVGTAPKRARGTKANWSSTAKMRAYLVAESIVKQLKRTCPVDPETKAAAHIDGCECSPFRKVYDVARLKYADAIHQTPCVRCGPAGKPAPIASPLSDGHKHARAMRAVSKELLKELWRESKRLHEEAAPAEAEAAPHP